MEGFYLIENEMVFNFLINLKRFNKFKEVTL